jgi:hypothetical protein
MPAWYNPNNFPVTLVFTMSNCVNLIYPCDTESITVGALSSNTVNNVGLPRDDSKPANWTMTWTVKSIGGSSAASSPNAPGTQPDTAQLPVAYVPVVVPAPTADDGIANIVSGFSALGTTFQQCFGGYEISNLIT